MRSITTHYLEARVLAELNHVQAALMLGITTAELVAIESGYEEPDALLVARMAILYDVSSDWLIGLIEMGPDN